MSAIGKIYLIIGIHLIILSPRLPTKGNAHLMGNAKLLAPCYMDIRGGRVTEVAGNVRI